MTNNVYEADVPYTIAELDDSPALDSDTAELSDEDAQRARDLRDSLQWYRRQPGWNRAEEKTADRLEDLVGTSDTDELASILRDDNETAELSDREAAIEECRERIRWYENHGWNSAAETEYDRLRSLKG